MRGGTGPLGECCLRRRGPNYELIVNGTYLMGSSDPCSEEVLARRTASYLRWGAHVLVGGLGMGFTLRALLACKRVERFDVVEVEPHVVRWNYTYLRQLNKGPCSMDG